MVEAVVHIRGAENAVPLLFVHGSGPSWGEETFAKQLKLSKDYKLLLLDRRGFGDSPDVERSDFEVDARDIISATGKGAHLIGHSYGGLGCLFAAGLHPELVRSLTVIEPPALGVARGEEAVESFISELKSARSLALRGTPEEYWAAFVMAIGFDPPPKSYFSNLSERDLKGIRSSMTERPPWEAEVPFDGITDARLPILVVSGGWKNAPPTAKARGGKALNVVCNVLEERLGAKRAVFDDANHGPHALGEPFNERLRSFIDST